MDERVYVDGGYILLSRKIIESEIWKKPPIYLKVWVYLLLKARHQSKDKWERGEMLISIPELQEECSYQVGYRKETPSKSQIYSIINWLRNSHEDHMNDTVTAPMIETTKTTRGMVCKVLNYSTYQDPKTYERNNDKSTEYNTEYNNAQTIVEHYTQECKNVNNVNNDVVVVREKFVKRFNFITKKTILLNKQQEKKLDVLIAKYGQEKTETVLEKIYESNYLKQRLDFDWLLEEKNYINVHNGKYKDFEVSKKPKKTHENISNSRTSQYTSQELDNMAKKKWEKHIHDLGISDSL